MTLSEIGVIASLLLNVGIAIAGATWGIAKIKDAVRDAIDKHKDHFNGELEHISRNFGETVQAIRQKVHEVELGMVRFESEAADKFIRRDSFAEVRQELAAEIKDLGRELKDRLERMEHKIDTKT